MCSSDLARFISRRHDDGHAGRIGHGDSQLRVGEMVHSIEPEGIEITLDPYREYEEHQEAHNAVLYHCGQALRRSG